MMNTIKPGQGIWVLERDEDDNIEDVSEVMFFANVTDAVIVSIYVEDFTKNRLCNLDETIAYRIEKAKEFGTPELYIYPAKDCFASKAEAQAVFDAESEIVW